MAQISFRFSGGFWPISFPLFHGTARPSALGAVWAVHALGKSPVITEDGLTIAESGAIIEYLIERHGEGRLIPPAGTPERLRYTYWLHFAEGSAMAPLLLSLLFGRLPRQPMP